jgi:hypothetical protein
MLNTRHGRTFAAIPRSVNQTSPRSGFATGRLLHLISTEQFGGDFIHRPFGESVLADTPALNLGGYLPPIFRRQGFKGDQ